MTAEEAAEAEAKLRDNMNKATLLGMAQKDMWREAGASIRENMAEIRQTQAEEQARMLEEAQEAARKAAIASAEAFGDIISGIQDRDIPDLITPSRDIVYAVSGPTAEQNALMEEYQELHDRAAERVRNLTFGIGTYGTEQEKVNEELAEANGEMAHYAALMQGLNLPATQFATTHKEMALNLDVARDSFFEMLQQAGAGTDILAGYGVSIGKFSEEEARAALITQELTTKMQNLAQQVADGLISPEQAERTFQAFYNNIQDDFYARPIEAPVTPVPSDVDNLDDYWQAEVKVTPVAEPVPETFWEEQLGTGTVPISVKLERDPADDAFFEEVIGGGTKRVTTGVDVTTTTDDAYSEIDSWYDSGQDRVVGFAIKTSDDQNSFATYQDEVTAFLEDEHIYTIEANTDPAADQIQAALDKFENFTVTVHANVVGIPAQGPETPYSSGQPTPPPAPPRDRVGGRASGGPVSYGRPYIVGEAGPELFIPNSSGQIVSNERIGASYTINFPMNFYGPTSPERVQTAVERAAETIVRAVEKAGKVA
jgi:hypothetical protein